MLLNKKGSGLWLAGIDLRRANLSLVDLSGANLGEAILTGANVKGTTMPDDTVHK